MTPRIASEADGLARQWAAAPAFMRHVGFASYGNRRRATAPNALKAVRAFKEHAAAEGMEQQWRGRRVLEVGVGDGWLGVELLKSVGVKRYLGVDLSDDSLAQTRGARRRRVSQRVATSSYHRRTCRCAHSRPTWW